MIGLLPEFYRAGIEKATVRDKFMECLRILAAAFRPAPIFRPAACAATTFRCGLLLSEHIPQTSPGKSDILHLAAASSTVRDSGSIGLLLVAQGRPSLSSLI